MFACFVGFCFLGGLFNLGVDAYGCFGCCLFGFVMLGYLFTLINCGFVVSVVLIAISAFNLVLFCWWFCNCVWGAYCIAGLLFVWFCVVCYLQSFGVAN